MLTFPEFAVAWASWRSGIERWARWRGWSSTAPARWRSP